MFKSSGDSIIYYPCSLKYNLSRTKRSLSLLDLQLPLNKLMVEIGLLDPRPSRPARCLSDVVHDLTTSVQPSPGEVGGSCKVPGPSHVHTQEKKVGLNLPAWVIEEYQKRPKVEMAKLLMNCNFDKARCLGSIIVLYSQFKLKRYYGSPHATHPSASQNPCMLTGEVPLRVGDNCHPELFEEHHCGIPVGEREGDERWFEMEPALWLKIVLEIIPKLGKLYIYTFSSHL